MHILTDDQINKARGFIFRNGRLLERKLFEYFFEGGTRQACLKALGAYQNPDGGFGNGIEPDLLCPDSTAIGAETALYVLDILGGYDAGLVDPLVDWIAANQSDAGIIAHPPPNMSNYPHQPWWQRPDDGRILVLAGLLGKWGIDAGEILTKARRYYLTTEPPEAGNFYGYPQFVYLRTCAAGSHDKARLDAMVENLPALLAAHGDHFPLLSRYWYHAADCVPEKVLADEARSFAAALQPDGGVETPYPDLPWWRPIFTLDGLILLKQCGFL